MAGKDQWLYFPVGGRKNWQGKAKEEACSSNWQKRRKGKRKRGLRTKILLLVLNCRKSLPSYSLYSYLCLHLPSLLLFLNFILFIFLYRRFLLVIYFIHISVYMSIPISQFITPPPPLPHHFPPLVSIRFFSTSLSQFLPCKPVHLYHFSRLYIYALIYDICFSLPDLLHSV